MVPRAAIRRWHRRSPRKSPQPRIHALAARVMSKVRIFLQRCLDQRLGTTQRFIKLLIVLLEGMCLCQGEQPRRVDVQITGWLAAFQEMSAYCFSYFSYVDGSALWFGTPAASPQQLDGIML